MTQECPPPIYQSITVTTIEWIDTHLHSPCLYVLPERRDVIRTFLSGNKRPFCYWKKVFYNTNEQKLISWHPWTSWHHWKMSSEEEKMKAASVSLRCGKLIRTMCGYCVYMSCTCFFFWLNVCYVCGHNNIPVIISMHKTECLVSALSVNLQTNSLLLL